MSLFIFSLICSTENMKITEISMHTFIQDVTHTHKVITLHIDQPLHMYLYQETNGSRKLMDKRKARYSRANTEELS